MSTLERQAPWQKVYQTKDERAVSWFQERPDISLDLIRATGVDPSASIIDIGGGASRLVDALISEEFKAVAVLDLSEKALATSKARLGAKGTRVQWIIPDLRNKLQRRIDMVTETAKRLSQLHSSPPIAP